MKRILLTLTGGTIGSLIHDGVIGTENSGCRILELYQQNYADCSFTVIQPLNLLSEELNVSHWEIIVNSILSQDLSKYDGIIITHGSDTLSYSSAMLSMCLHSIGVPVIITAADLVPDDINSNALINFRAAVILISHFEGGVYTVYRNRGDQFASVFLPTALCEADRLLDRFTPFGSTSLGYVTEQGFVSSGALPSPEQAAAHKGLVLEDKLSLKKHVMLVRPYPSIDYEHIFIPDDIAAVLHITYHSATVSTKALSLLGQCKEKNIPFVLCSLKASKNELYETSSCLLEHGAVPMYDISSESAYAKLLLGVNLFPDDLRNFIDRNIYFERRSENEN